MTPRKGVQKKVSPKPNNIIYNYIPFLDRPLQSILRFMQENRMNKQSTLKVQTSGNEQPALESKLTIYEHPILKVQPSLHEQNPENYMYYNLRNTHPFDPISLKQMEVFGGIFSNENNKETLLRVLPRYFTNYSYTYNQEMVKPIPYSEQNTYSEPIGPLPFLSSTVPYKPKKQDLDYLDFCSKK
jgi:hypothetical protein